MLSRFSSFFPLLNNYFDIYIEMEFDNREITRDFSKWESSRSTVTVDTRVFP